ncbi:MULTISPECIES: LacI family DNA-binding transcriptional regulator [Microbacterium]|uniref:LacI family DNA-binding transcriptional regulator n=1 Tax=Microbacterium TaxID=33882 RepID=UPI002782E9C9|nr:MULTISPECIES: LacI family DNA-binding transcriptional regulator [Microbacterium]MDQ1082660.1 LacI family transcriptional regulator [Microbacterium sp. SORGH_AS_0344]MDQ1168568.1 LacI family transcriptional regulator [Microbacterium proteolyticum]
MTIERATLHEVAAAAGVSLASASRALTGGSASVAMVQKVRRAARRVGYVPDATARSLRLGGTRQVLFAVDDIGNLNYVAMLRAIEREFADTGIRLSVTTTGRDVEQTVALVQSMNMGVGDALIISPLRVSPSLRRALSELIVPVVVIGSLQGNVPVDMVRVDSGHAVQLAVEHLQSLGRRRIGFVNGPLNTNPGVSRRHGYLAAMEAAGIAVDGCFMEIATDFTIKAGRAAGQRILDRCGEMGLDAIVGGNDLLAVGIINACLAAGLRVPHDIAVTGVDDTEYAASYNPSITTVSLQSAERGRLAAQLLLARFEDPTRPPETATVMPSLVARSSTQSGDVNVD